MKDVVLIIGDIKTGESLWCINPGIVSPSRYILSSYHVLVNVLDANNKMINKTVLALSNYKRLYNW